MLTVRVLQRQAELPADCPLKARVGTAQAADWAFGARCAQDENQNACQTSVMKINFTVPTFSVFRVDEIEFLSQLDENKLRKWEREQHESGNYRARFPARLSGLRLQVD